MAQVVRGRFSLAMSASREHLDEFVERMRSSAGQNLESIILYGSGSREDFNETYSDLNLLCAFHDLSGAELLKVVPVLKWWAQSLRQRPPLLMTTEEFRSSADVFAIEVIDMQTHHRVLHGADIVLGVEVSMDMHRVELERELRTTLLKLRQHFVFARDDEDELKRVLIRSVPTVVTLFRHALITLGEAHAIPRSAVLKRIADTLAIDVSPFETAVSLREGRKDAADYRVIFERYIHSLAAVISAIDRGGTKRS